MTKKPEKSTKPAAGANVSKDEQVGFHKGALSTLAKEREEMLKIVQVVEQLMQMHIKALKDLGVDLEAQAKDALKKGQAGPAKKGKKGQLDELI